MPRVKETYFKITKGLEWTFENSLFRAYTKDSKDGFDKGFEFDWEASRLGKIINDGNALECKALLKSNY
jgi:hypothetical protein